MQDIARAGQYLGKLVQQVADEVHVKLNNKLCSYCTHACISHMQCPDESCRKDLLAYMERMQLCCHQLKITSSVSADLGESVKEAVR